MAQFSVHVNKNDIRKFNKTMFMLKNFASNEFTKSVQTVASNIVGLAKMRSPVDTGALRQSITTDSKRIGPYIIEAAVVAEMDYAALVEFGTSGPYTISVKNAKVLTDGKKFFGKKVTIPKRKPQPYFFNSVRDGLRHFNKDIQIKIKKISTRWKTQCILLEEKLLQHLMAI